MQEILVLYYSHRGSVRALAEQIALGIHQVPGAAARVRTVPRVSTVCEAVEDEIPADGPPYAEVRDLEECVGSMRLLAAAKHQANLPAGAEAGNLDRHQGAVGNLAQRTPPRQHGDAHTHFNRALDAVKAGQRHLNVDGRVSPFVGA